MTSTLPAQKRGQTGTIGGLEYVVYGAGEPVTVFAHGLAGSISEIKPLAMPLSGTRVLFHFRGHGQSAPLTEGWHYDLLAEDLLTVADAFDASQACGLSLGCGAILRVLMANPNRFDRLGFVMPAALNQQRSQDDIGRLVELGAAIESRDLDQLIEVLKRDVPSELHGDRVTHILLARRAAELLAMTPPAPGKPDNPVTDMDQLANITAPSLVLAQRNDRLHSVEIAEELARNLASADLRVVDPGGIFWTQAETTRSALIDHFG